MATGFHPKDNGENDLIGNILSDENAQDFFNLRLSMGRSISAPPPGLTDILTSSTPDITKAEVDPTSTKDYYYYYHSLKPHDPRLPKPKWKPVFYDQEHLTNIPNIIQEGHSESAGTNPDESSVDDFSSQFDQSVNLNTTKDTLQADNHQNESPKDFYGNNGRKLGNTQMGQGRGHNQNQGNYERKGGWGANGGHQQQKQHGYNQQRNQNQGQNFGYNQNQNFNNQMNPNMQQGQGQFYSGNQQQMGNFYPNNFAGPQMQPQQPYYGMNPYQPPMFPYGSDPNMMNNMAPENKFQQYPQGNNMGQMNGMNQMYMNGAPYMNNFYPMNMQPPMQPQFQNNFQQQNQPYGNRNQKGGNRQQHQSHQNQPKLDIKQVLANLSENCRDQNGSRLIQQHFEKAGEEERETMFQEILPETLDLMTDVFGNYVVQKILELGTNQQRQRIFEVIKNNVYKLSQNTYGCRVVQKILEEFKHIQFIQDVILTEISQNIVLLVEDQNGNHVVQKCFETVSLDKLQFVIDEVSQRIEKLAVHPYGCRVIQKILETAPEERVAPMLRKLMDNALTCCQCQYGNYIMQHVLEKGPNNEKEMLLEALKKNFTKLSMNKFASNVTEKSARFGTHAFRSDVVGVITSSYHDNKIGLVALITHPYGNYVVQRLFECSDEKTKRKICEKLKQENLDEIKKNSYGRHVMSFIEKWMEGQQF